MKKQLEKSSGVTLIVLVITIVVLIVIATISITLSLREGGIFGTAETAKQMQELAGIKEESDLIKSDLMTESYTEKVVEVNKSTLMKSLEKHFEGTIEGNKVIVKDGKYEILVDNNLNITVEERIIDVWDGTTIDTEWYDDSKNDFKIKTAAQLAGLSQIVSTGNYLMGKNIYLENDIDLNNKNWTSIGSTSYFSGNFYGQNNTIYNLNSENKTYDGLFGLLYKAQIKDLNVENIRINNSVYSGGIASFVYDGATIQNVNLSGDITINTLYTGGGIVGWTQGNCIIQEITLTGNVKVVGPYYVAGIAGYSTGIPTIKDITIKVDDESYVKATSAESINNVGGIVGVCTGSFAEPNINFATIENCYSNINVVIAGVGAGGIAGYVDAAIIKNCKVEADVSLNAVTNEGKEYLTIGGITGYTCHSGDVNNVTIDNCTFNGNLKYSINGEIQSDVTYSNNGIAGCDRINTSQNLKVNNCYFNKTQVNIGVN